ncbi:MAG: phosphoribosylformylglycinamidine cyclo-ligase [Deltaproteobacteria bacterium]|nr:phosphoribosylformylglycinamidine cyclo-ligase [Deltaproteobacteria bacterium]
MDAYKQAGVDANSADLLIDDLTDKASKTFDKQVIGGLGGFAALYEIDLSTYSKPILVTSTDGVGTKLKIAMMAQNHKTIGIDLVAMCVNDILCTGADPKLFLDYYATGKLDPAVSKEIFEGILKGCEIAGCSLVGGETAEMPGFYKPGEYDLAGFAAGFANRENLFRPEDIHPGDVLIGIASSGLHSNGYSLVRRIIVSPDKSLLEELLKPTHIYVKLIQKLRKLMTLKGIAHITGSGIPGNLPRILPKHCKPIIKTEAWKKPAIFEFLKSVGTLSDQEMLNTFNCGVGLVLVVDKNQSNSLLSAIHQENFEAWPIGHIIKATDNEVLFE